MSKLWVQTSDGLIPVGGSAPVVIEGDKDAPPASLQNGQFIYDDTEPGWDVDSRTFDPSIEITSTDEPAELILNSGGTLGTPDDYIRFQDDGVDRWIMQYSQNLNEWGLLRYDAAGVYQDKFSIRGSDGQATFPGILATIGTNVTVDSAAGIAELRLDAATGFDSQIRLNNNGTFKWLLRSDDSVSDQFQLYNYGTAGYALRVDHATSDINVTEDLEVNSWSVVRQVASISSATDVVIGTGGGDITGMTHTFTSRSGYSYEVEFTVCVFANSNVLTYTFINVNGGSSQGSLQHTIGTNVFHTVAGRYQFGGTGASTTVKLTGLTSSLTATWGASSAVYRNQMVIREVGRT